MEEVSILCIFWITNVPHYFEFDNFLVFTEVWTGDLQILEHMAYQYATVLPFECKLEKNINFASIFLLFLAFLECAASKPNKQDMENEKRIKLFHYLWLKGSVESFAYDGATLAWKRLTTASDAMATECSNSRAILLFTK